MTRAEQYYWQDSDCHFVKVNDNSILAIRKPKTPSHPLVSEHEQGMIYLAKKLDEALALPPDDAEPPKPADILARQDKALRDFAAGYEDKKRRDELVRLINKWLLSETFDKVQAIYLMDRIRDYLEGK